MLGRGHPVTAQVVASVASAERSLLPRTASHLPLAEQTTSPRSASASAVRIRMLGPLQVRGEHGWHPIMAPKWRSVLAALLINANQVVSADTLIDEVWGEAVPARAANVVSIYVLRLRRLIGDTDGSLLVTQAPGYLLRIDDTVIDARLFEMMVGEGRQMLAADEPERAAGRLAEALALWQGSPLADVPRSRQVAAEAQRLADLKLDATELRITAELQCGGEAQVVPELRRLLADNPLREGLRRLLMQALVGSGRMPRPSTPMARRGLPSLRNSASTPARSCAALMRNCSQLTRLTSLSRSNLASRALKSQLSRRLQTVVPALCMLRSRGAKSSRSRPLPRRIHKVSRRLAMAAAIAARWKRFCGGNGILQSRRPSTWSAPSTGSPSCQALSSNGSRAGWTRSTSDPALSPN